MPLEDKQLRLRCVREIARRPVDYSQLRVQALNNVVYLAGTIRPIQRGVTDIDKELEIIVEAIQHLPGVKEVVTHELKVLKA
jgi:osmotically-inducible protein OsmY